jgi:hypothetical protein
MAGKGDWYRPVDAEKYETNWGFIFDPPVCKVCKQPLRQWLPCHKIAYCKNKECELYLVKIERK